jgi:hypothetical protein
MIQNQKERPRASGTWTESRYWSFIRSNLRKAWSKYPVRHKVKAKAKREIAKSKRKGRRRFEYQCNGCKKWFYSEDVSIDHINPVGSLKCADDLPAFVENLFCEEDNLQVLCNEKCHYTKTQEERKNAKSNSNST